MPHKNGDYLTIDEYMVDYNGEKITFIINISRPPGYQKLLSINHQIFLSYLSKECLFPSIWKISFIS